MALSPHAIAPYKALVGGNPRSDLIVANTLTKWDTDGAPRRAGVGR